MDSNLNSEIIWSPPNATNKQTKHNHKTKQKDKKNQQQQTTPQRELFTLRAKTIIPNSSLRTPLAA